MASRISAACLLTGALALGGCATRGAVEHAQATADQALQQAQAAGGAAQHAQQSADAAMSAAQQAQQTATQAAQAAQAAATDARTANSRLDSMSTQLQEWAQKKAEKGGGGKAPAHHKRHKGGHRGYQTCDCSHVQPGATGVMRPAQPGETPQQ